DLAGLSVLLRLWPALVQHRVLFRSGQRNGELQVLSAVGRPPDVPTDRARRGQGTGLPAPDVRPGGDRHLRDGLPGRPGIPVPAAAGRTGHGGGAPMSTLTHSSTSLAVWAGFDRAAIARREPLRTSSLPWRTAWARPTAGPGARLKRAVDVVGAMLGLVVF